MLIVSRFVKVPYHCSMYSRQWPVCAQRDRNFVREVAEVFVHCALRVNVLSIVRCFIL